MTETHVIFGAGQVGVPLARELATMGKEVRLVRRGEPGAAISGVTWLRGDITDPAFADEASDAASVIYNCVNPADYHRWDELLPPLTRACIGAASRSGARLVVLDNLYMYGDPKGLIKEDTPMRPCSKKGALRKQLAEELLAADERGEIEVAIGRASDFFGPSSPNAAIFHERFFNRLLAGKAVEVMGDPDMPHSYSYVPDVAKALAVLGTSEQAFGGAARATFGRVWHLPVAAQVSTRQLIESFARHARVEARLRRVPTWALRALGLVVPLLAAVAEMTYQWDVPYIVDDSAFRGRFGLEATPLDEATRATLAPRHQEQAA